jgi:transposase
MHARIAAPPGATGDAGAAALHVTRALLAALRALVEQIDVLTDQITEQLHAHADAQVFTSLPRAGTVRAARLLAEIGGARRRFPTPEALASLSGVAPSTRQIGQEPYRRVPLGGGPPAARRAVEWAGDSRLSNPWPPTSTNAPVAEATTHPHAVRVLAAPGSM